MATLRVPRHSHRVGGIVGWEAQKQPLEEESRPGGGLREAQSEAEECVADAAAPSVRARAGVSPDARGEDEGSDRED